MMQDQNTIKQYDRFIEDGDWLKADNLPVAIVLTEKLKSVEAIQSNEPVIIFPPTYATQKKNEPYNIDHFQLKDISSQQAALEGKEANLCRIDSVGSQANRMEICFKKPLLNALVPQSTVTQKEQRKNLLEAGHRIADAAVRLSDVRDKCDNAINALMEQSNAEPLAKLAPTSLVFGFWDSRETQFKFGRILSSTINATNVEALTRSSQYSPTFDPSGIELKGIDPAALQLEQSEQEEQAATAEKDVKLLANVGLQSVPSTKTHGGVRVYGEIMRQTTINLVGLRALAVPNEPQTNVQPHTKVNGNAQSELDKEKTMKLRRYLLGLALVAGRSQTQYDLRQGCLLVNAKNPIAELVYPNGKREPFAWERGLSLDYAKLAADDFGVGEEFEANFDNKKAQEAIDREKGKAEGKKAKGRSKSK